jgi:hypothetical protein
MASSQPMSGRPHEGQVLVNAGRLWGGGLATACVAALVALVGVLVFGVVIDVSLVRPALLLDVASTFAADYALTAFLLALLATGVAHALALTTPRPRMFFSWIVGLATVAGTAASFGHALAQGTERGQVHDDVALAVGRTAAVPAAVDLGELEGWCAPGLLVEGGWTS